MRDNLHNLPRAASNGSIKPLPEAQESTTQVQVSTPKGGRAGEEEEGTTGKCVNIFFFLLLSTTKNCLHVHKCRNYLKKESVVNPFLFSNIVDQNQQK